MNIKSEFKLINISIYFPSTAKTIGVLITHLFLQKEMFIQSHGCKSVRLFLEWFVETAMFRHFMNTKYSTDVSYDECNYDSSHYALFDARLLEKSENKTNVDDNIEIIMKNSKIINKKAKTFKDRFKEFIHSN